MSQISVKDASNATVSVELPLPPGRAAATASRPVALSNEDNATIGAQTETVPATDTASSGLNGRLQRVAQRLSSLIALLPATLGQKTMANSLAVTVASDQGAVPVSGTFWQATQPVNGTVTANAGTGTFAISAASLPLPTGAATSANQAALNALFPTSLGTKTAANSFAVTLASDGPLTVVSGTITDAAVANGSGGTIAGYLRSIKDAATDTTSASPVRLPGKYATVAASTTAQALGTGAVGDYLSHVTIIPASTSPGAVSITDGSGSAITIFAGGASSVSNLVPFAVPLGLLSTSGGWKITTGANVSAIAEGKF